MCLTSLTRNQVTSIQLDTSPQHIVGAVLFEHVEDHWIRDKTFKSFNHQSSVDLFASLCARLAALTFAEGTFPSRFKVASVTPLLKKKGLDRSVYANLRPISNLHIISQIIEQASLSRITVQVESSPSYNRFQSTYRCGHATETAITRLL